MKKAKATTLLTVICLLLVALMTMTFLRFTAGITDYNSILGAINLDYDIAGGYSYTLEIADDNEAEIDDEEVIKTLSTRLDYLGYKGYEIKAVKNTDANVSAEQINSDFIINVPAFMNEYGEDDVTTATSNIQVVARYGIVEFFGGTQNDTSTQIMNEEPAIEYAKYVGAQSDGQQTYYVVEIKFTQYGYDALKAAVESATETFYLKVTLGDSTILNGEFSLDSVQNRTISVTMGDETLAKQAALQMSMGGLEYKFDASKIEAAKITPLLGENTGTYIVIAIAVIVLLAVAFFIGLGRGYGIVNAISLVSFIFVTTSMLVAIPGIVVSIPGVIGIVASLIMTIASLTVTGRYITEEYAKGKTVKSAIKTGYNLAFRPILNANVITLACALLIFALGSGAMVSFGITLAIGSAISFMATVLLSRLLTSCFVPLCKNPEGFYNLKRTEE